MSDKVMKLAVKLVDPLTKEPIQELKAVATPSAKHRTRQRAHAILLSSDGFSIDEIAKILGVGRETVSRWRDKWEPSGLEGLRDNPG